MEQITLDVQVRKEFGSRKTKFLRHHDLVPGIVYGGPQKTPTPVKIERRVYEKIMRAHRGQNVLFQLNVMEGEKKLRDYAAIVREEQHDPVHEKLLHVDFQRINLTEEIEVQVQIVPKGEAIGIKKEGGSLDQPMHELDVICLPTNIPDQVNVDVTNLTIGDAVHVGDLVLPAGVRTKHDPKAIVLSIVPPMKEEATPEATITEPELIREKKEKAEGEEGAAASEKAQGKSEKKEEKK